MIEKPDHMTEAQWADLLNAVRRYFSGYQRQPQPQPQPQPQQPTGNQS